MTNELARGPLEGNVIAARMLGRIYAIMSNRARAFVFGAKLKKFKRVCACDTLWLAGLGGVS